MRLRPAFVAIVFAALEPAGAQGTGRSAAVGPVHGVVFDSLRGRPLRDAFVSIVGGERSTTTDARGRFHFDSVPLGVATFAVQHAALDSLGFSGLSARATITGGDDDVRVSVPSFATLWREACGTRAPADSGLVFGTIRDARSKSPVAGATIAMAWSEYAIGDKRRLIDRRWRIETRSAAEGDYAVCGAPADARPRVRAATDSAASGTIELPMAGRRVQRRDLLIGSVGAARESAGQGIVVGLVSDPSGAPFADARIVIDDSAEARSDSDGRFTLRGVATGTRQLELRFIGINPVLSTVDVAPGDTTIVTLWVPKLTMLPTVNVTSPERARVLLEEFNERMIMYRRYMIDSSVIGRQRSMVNVFYGLPSVTVQYLRNGDFTLKVPDGRGKSCTPELRVDGAIVNDFGQLSALPTERVAGVEVYPHAFAVPGAFQRGGIRYPCGLVVVWTKWAFRLP